MIFSPKQKVSLAPYTTFRVGGDADFFTDVFSQSELIEALEWCDRHNLPHTILGNGSNVLVSDEGIRGLVLRPRFLDVNYLNETITAGAGVSFDDLISCVIKKGWWGLENLSGIPGTVGATPIQNVGAYGVEVGEYISAVTVCNTENREIRRLTHDECQFGYRSSFFKSEEGKKYIVLDVTFSLSSKQKPRFVYGELSRHFDEKRNPTLYEIRQTVLDIRMGKFPNLRLCGSAGSFFKNPIVDCNTKDELKKTYSHLPVYALDKDHYKIALGWILDHVCGMRGFCEGKVRLYEKQALVLVCEEGATAHEVNEFAEKIAKKVYESIGIHIDREVVMMQ